MEFYHRQLLLVTMLEMETKVEALVEVLIYYQVVKMVKMM